MKHCALYARPRMWAVVALVAGAAALTHDVEDVVLSGIVTGVYQWTTADGIGANSSFVPRFYVRNSGDAEAAVLQFINGRLPLTRWPSATLTLVCNGTGLATLTPMVLHPVPGPVPWEASCLAGDLCWQSIPVNISGPVTQIELTREQLSIWETTFVPHERWLVIRGTAADDSLVCNASQSSLVTLYDEVAYYEMYETWDLTSLRLLYSWSDTLSEVRLDPFTESVVFDTSGTYAMEFISDMLLEPDNWDTAYLSLECVSLTPEVTVVMRFSPLQLDIASGANLDNEPCIAAHNCSFTSNIVMSFTAAYQPVNRSLAIPRANLSDWMAAPYRTYILTIWTNAPASIVCRRATMSLSFNYITDLTLHPTNGLEWMTDGFGEPFDVDLRLAGAPIRAAVLWFAFGDIPSGSWQYLTLDLPCRTSEPGVHELRVWFGSADVPANVPWNMSCVVRGTCAYNTSFSVMPQQLNTRESYVMSVSGAQTVLSAWKVEPVRALRWVIFTTTDVTANVSCWGSDARLYLSLALATTDAPSSPPPPPPPRRRPPSRNTWGADVTLYICVFVVAVGVLLPGVVWLRPARKYGR